MDINIPGLNGEQLLQEIRKTSDIPVIMVTSRTTEIDEILSMSYGADDYIVKPFDIQEVLLRIRVLLRRKQIEETKQNISPINQNQLSLIKEQKLKDIQNGISSINLLTTYVFPCPLLACINIIDSADCVE